MRPILTLTTDFGEGSRYVAAMKGVVLSIAPDVTLVDISHAVPPQDVAAGARVLAEATPWFPAGTLHVAVIDPGVGTDRRIVYAEIGFQRYVCPDNGLLGQLAADVKPRKLHCVTEAEHWLPKVSRTFHGRDVMAPVAARLCLGLAPERLGPAIEGLTPLAAAKGRRVGQRIEGEVVEVDSFGNLITNITSELLAEAPRDASVTIECDGHQTIGIYETYAEQPAMTLIALIGSSGALELAIVNDSAAMMLGVRTGAQVVVSW